MRGALVALAMCALCAACVAVAHSRGEGAGASEGTGAGTGAGAGAGAGAGTGTGSSSTLGKQEGSRYAFFRSMTSGLNTRRLFGGTEARAGAWPGACALLDSSMTPRCSCAVLAPRWALTAAHCATPRVAYVQFNGLYRNDSNLVAVKLVYAHPQYLAVIQDEGAGPDVVTLHNDVGLVRTRGDMVLSSYSYFPRPAVPRTSHDKDIVQGMLIYNVDDLLDEEIDILGFGMTETKPAGERLRETRLRLASCGRVGWGHCACAVGAASGVCSGDSGGPVLYNDTQIGVMSMGPVECGTPLPLGDRGAGSEAVQAVSVFTAVRPFVQLINDTIHNVDSELRMREVWRADRAAAAAAAVRGLRKLPSSICAVSLLLCRYLKSDSLFVYMKTGVFCFIECRRGWT